MKTEKLAPDKIEDPVYDGHCIKCSIKIESAFSGLGEEQTDCGNNYVLGRCPECSDRIWFEKRDRELFHNSWVWYVICFVLSFALASAMTVVILKVLK